MKNSKKLNMHNSQINTYLLQGLPEILSRYDIDPSEFLTRYGMATQDLEKDDVYISYLFYTQILQDAGQECGSPHIGLLLSHATSRSISGLSFLGMLLKMCNTVGDTMEAMIKYYNVVSEGTTYELITKAEHTWFVRHGRFAQLKDNRILQDLSLSDFTIIFANMVGDNWHPEKIQFTYPTPEYHQIYNELMGCPVEFNAQQQAIQFSSSLLGEKVYVSKSLLEQFKLEFSSAPDQSQNTFRETVAKAIDLLLPAGICGANSISKLFDLHPRTLRRHLQKEGISFAGLIEERRKKHSQFFLQKTSMNIIEISIALGYSAPETFTRAFRKWFGILPSEWRKLHKSVNS